MIDNGTSSPEVTDVLLIGSGIMSVTLASLFRILEPAWKISSVEKLSEPALESTFVTHNAGTGHSAFCELNYTPKTPSGISVNKAVSVAESFKVSLQYWSHLVDSKQLTNPAAFINRVPHVSYVQGKENVIFLRERWEALIKQPLFKGMQFSDSLSELEKELPLLNYDNSNSTSFAFTTMNKGVDINFSALTKQIFDSIKSEIDSDFNTEIKDLKQLEDGTWLVVGINSQTKEEYSKKAKFVFIGAGGGALLLLQKAKIAEIKGVGGFPVNGEFLYCNNEKLISKHFAKVYGKPETGAPPMSSPHLDTRIIDGKKALLFGPFAGWSSKFLIKGKYTDLFKSIRINNLLPMAAVGVSELSLTKYLIKEVLKHKKQKINELRKFMPSARIEDWDLKPAGQRVQIIKPTKFGGTLEFGTDIVSTTDGTLAGLIGASPGASISVSAMLSVLEKNFPSSIDKWRDKLVKIIPSYGQSLNDNEALLGEISKWIDDQFNLKV